MVLRRRLETKEPGKEVETNGCWNQRKPFGDTSKGSQSKSKSAHVHWTCKPFKIKTVL